MLKRLLIRFVLASVLSGALHYANPTWHPTLKLTPIMVVCLWFVLKEQNECEEECWQ